MKASSIQSILHIEFVDDGISVQFGRKRKDNFSVLYYSIRFSVEQRRKP